MIQYNFPTIVLLGQGSLEEAGKRIALQGNNKILLVSDETLLKIGLVEKVSGVLKSAGLECIPFAQAKPNPHEDDVTAGVAVYKENNCDAIVALGGGSPMDAAKAIKVMATHDGPLAKYDDTRGGDAHITNPMPPLYAIPTTAGTGSEVGRSGVIIVKETGVKTIIFHPDLLPDIAVLEPELTKDLPPHITAATGIDAFSHCLEAYLSPGFHPMADGIALEGIKLILDWLPVAVEDGSNLEAREKMLIAATMGATAFQKGLGMVHSLAHPLSSQHHMHHGLANALMIPPALEFIEEKIENDDRKRLIAIQALFNEFGYYEDTLSENTRLFFEKLGVKPGLGSQNIQAEDIDALSIEAFADPCHSGNIIPVTRDDLAAVYKKAL